MSKIPSIVRAETVNNISILISIHLQQAKNEQYNPIHSADAMDDYISYNLSRAKELRRIREEFENISIGVLL